MVSNERAGLPQRLLAATMLGVGALLSPRGKVDDHWSTAPKVTIEVEVEGVALAPPPGPDQVLAADRRSQALRRRRRRRWFRR